MVLAGLIQPHVNAGQTATGIGGSMVASTMMTAEELAKLRRIALAFTDFPMTLDPGLVELFDLGAANEAVHARQMAIDRSAGHCLITFPLTPGSDDVIFTVMLPGITRLFLSSSSRTLRAALVLTSAGLQKIEKTDSSAWETATTFYQSQLGIWAEYARTAPEPH